MPYLPNSRPPNQYDARWMRHFVDQVRNSLNHVDDANISPDKISQIAPNCIGAEQLIPGAVTQEKIAVGAITADQLADGSITDVKLALGTIASDKLNLTKHILY